MTVAVPPIDFAQFSMMMRSISQKEAQEMAYDTSKYTLTEIMPLYRWACEHPYDGMVTESEMLVLADTGGNWVVGGFSDTNSGWTFFVAGLPGGEAQDIFEMLHDCNPLDWVDVVNEEITERGSAVGGRNRML